MDKFSSILPSQTNNMKGKRGHKNNAPRDVLASSPAYLSIGYVKKIFSFINAQNLHQNLIRWSILSIFHHIKWSMVYFMKQKGYNKENCNIPFALTVLKLEPALLGLPHQCASSSLRLGRKCALSSAGRCKPFKAK